LVALLGLGGNGEGASLVVAVSKFALTDLCGFAVVVDYDGAD
jgi:hypothetical protein